MNTIAYRFLLRVGVFVLFLMFVGCSEKISRNNIKSIFIDISDTVDQKDMNTLFQRLDLIPLELNQKSAIKFPKKILAANGYYYILDTPSSSVLQFTSQGSYVQTIENIGFGPYEYNVIEDISINRYTGNVEILDPTGKIVVFDPKVNKFTKEYKLPFHQELKSVHRFVNVNSDTLLIHSFFGRNQLHWFSRKLGTFIHSDFERKLNFGFFQFETLKEINGKPFFININDNKIYEFEGIKPKVFKSFNFGMNDLGQIENLFSKNTYNSDIQREKVENLLSLNDIAYPICNFFFNINALQFIYSGKIMNYQIQNDDEIIKLDSFYHNVNGAPLIYENKNSIYGMILNAQNYKRFIPQKFLTKKNKKILDEWKVGDNIIIMKYTVSL